MSKKSSRRIILTEDDSEKDSIRQKEQFRNDPRKRKNPNRKPFSNDERKGKGL